MKNFFALGLTIALAWGCDANHVLGVATGNGGQQGGHAGTGGAAGNGTLPQDAGETFVDGPGPGTAAGNGALPHDAGGTILDASGSPVGPSQTWTGYVENFMFPSGSDALTLTVAADSQGNPVGTIVLGHTTPPAPATDPNVGYPPGYGIGISELNTIAGPVDFYVEGYPYPFDQGALTPQRLHFTANLEQLWAGWCALQTEGGDSGSCLPSAGSMFSADGTSCVYEDRAGQSVSVNCGKLALCGRVGPCACTQSGCTLTSTPGKGEVLSLDIAINGNNANGAVDGPFGTQNVQFTKSP
jgi:hypothetical protein